nr:uncharacterized protein LOC111513663 [Leptinotarsa decemlineata]
MDKAVIPHPPALPNVPLSRNIGSEPYAKKNNLSRNGSVKSKRTPCFRLVEHNYQNEETGSVYSIYKQKIDSMFESDSSSSKNSVQAKIERMFSDVAMDNGIPLDDIGLHNFSVDYLGSVPLQEKVTSLSGLQNPLKELYFAYKKIIRSPKTLTGRLEISSSGLKVQYQGEKGDLEQLNSFPTIAVWSAVKFVIHGSPKFTYAFLPLITDPDNMEKQTLFRTLDENEKKYITTEAHSPLFAVVMRKIGVHKQLECHGFVCQTSEDAIVIAATLYKSLVAHMKAKERRPRNKNGVTTCMSVASSLNKDKQSNSIPVRPPRKKRSSTSSVISGNDAISISDTKPLLDNRPPKKSSKTKRAPKAPDSNSEDLDAILPYEEPISPNQINEIKNEGEKHDNRVVEEIKPKSFTDKLNSMSQEQKQLTAEIKQMMSDGGTKCLKKVQSVRKNEETPMKKENSGDILTKVTIPRSGSFLNAGGLTRYKSKISRSNDQGSGGSPLGFKEIFNELSLQEGLHSLDDILSVIIDPEGMSFNDLKPIYKEFLLKLSLTLTKDELYQRSKSIMRRQKKKLLRKSPHQKHHILVGGKFRRLKHIFQKNLKMRLGRNLKQVSPKKYATVPLQIDSKLPESSISTSSYDTRQFRPKDDQNVMRKQSYRKKSADSSRRRKDRVSTSEESDFFSLKKSKAQGFQLLHVQNRNSSSGYVSCSECSYDSDTCTCRSADKCYCSLGQRSFAKNSKCSESTCRNDSMCSCNQTNVVLFCDCDTDSCAESNKCYCPSGNNNSSLAKHLIQRGKIQDNHHRHKKVCRKSSNSKSSKSLEYILNPHETYYEKLKRSKFGTQTSMPILGRNCGVVDYEHLSVVNGSHVQGFHSRPLYSKGSFENGSGFGPCRPASVKEYGSIRSKRQTAKVVQSSAISGASTEALSVKKSAEIAALFADIKLSQTTDITQLAPTNLDLSMVSSRNSYNKSYSQHKHSKSSKLTSNRAEPRATPHYIHHQKIHNIPCRNTNATKSGSIRNGLNSMKNGNLYSAKNGLYTIQSQSDESRRSSTCEARKFEDRKDYFELDPRFVVDMNSNNISSNSIENSLGYLP